MNTLLFSEQYGAFMSFLSDEPMHYVRLSGVEYYIDANNNLIEMNTGYSIGKNSLIKFVTNNEFTQTKVFDNTELFFEQKNTAFVDTATFYTSNQKSSASRFDFDRREASHRLSIPRNSLTRCYPERMRDKYLISEYTIDSGKLGADKYYTLPYVKTRFRYSFI